MGETVEPCELDQTALDNLSEMTGDDPDFLAEMINTYLDDGPNLIAEMQVAAADGDWATLRRASHTLKSHSRTFGAAVLGDLCQEIETQSAAGGGGTIATFTAAPLPSMRQRRPP